MNLADRTEQAKDDADIQAWLSGKTCPHSRMPATPTQSPAPSIAPSEMESDADDITIMTLQAPVAMPAMSRARQLEAREFERQNPMQALRVPGKYLEQRAHLDAITTFWGGCPSKVLTPALIPKTVRPPTAPPGPISTTLGVMDWDPELVKGLRMLAPLCSAKDANFWLIAELRKERREVDTDKEFMTKHTVHAVYKAFTYKGYKEKTLVQAQKENREKAALLAGKALPKGVNNSPWCVAKEITPNGLITPVDHKAVHAKASVSSYVPTVPEGNNPLYETKGITLYVHTPPAGPKPLGEKEGVTPYVPTTPGPPSPVPPVTKPDWSKPTATAEQRAEARKLYPDFVPPWEMDPPADTPMQSQTY